MSDPQAELRLAASHARDALHAAAMAMQIGLAAETHPEELRTALGHLFDLGLWEEQAARIEGKFAGIIAAEQERHDRIRALEDRVWEQQELIDALWAEIDELNGTVAKVRRWAKSVQTTFARIRKWAGRIQTEKARTK